MKNCIQLIVFIFFITSNVSAQKEISIEDLKTPNSPGFQILDIAPTSIERPVNPKALAVSLLSLTSSGTVIPKNFAMEISPYWYTKSDNASVYQYLSINTENKETSDFSGILRKMSISMASVFSDSTSGSLIKNTNYISFGVRTNLFTYRTAAQNEKLQQSLKNITEKIKEIKSNNVEKKKLLGLRTRYRNDLNNEPDQDKKAVIISKIDSIQTQIDNLIEASPEEMEKKLDADEDVQKNMKSLKELPLFQLDGAFAYSEAIPGNKYENNRFNRSGFWFNASLNAFSIDKEKLEDNLSILGTLRFIRDNALVENTLDEFKKNKAFDYGFKAEYTVKDFSISIEYLKREYSGNSALNSERTVGVLEYKLNDNLYFTGTYGKNFGQENNLFTLFGINYGFGKSSLKTE
ncbi:hypothetical protein [Flavobacterium soyae]|uniref:hypothetical protein n=1 Tax=Flavobacterium soyae TaxID=2903098 RepID=UPI001E4A6514|nr:hypothetical protein [Flavobacterium soyae]MCD9575990.1 hypothetical protein [Flavobacterium soyae]